LLKAGKELPALDTIFTVEGSLLDEVNAILRTQWEETYDLLVEKWSAVERVAQELMSRDLLDQDELDRLINGASTGDRKF
jgi:ATP-dependent Zn protease